MTRRTFPVTSPAAAGLPMSCRGLSWGGTWGCDAGTCLASSIRLTLPLGAQDAIWLAINKSLDSPTKVLLRSVPRVRSVRRYVRKVHLPKPLSIRQGEHGPYPKKIANRCRVRTSSR